MIPNIQDILTEIEEKENVKIIAAFEVGSRAWGLESPDSDYDVRFIYVRNINDYLKLNEVRDVIEWQLDDTLDVNGWDIRKVLKLLYKSNATVFEWLSSPIAYRTSEECEKLKDLLPIYFSKKRLIFHYYKLARNNYKRYLQTDTVKLKEYLYVIRFILASKWIINNNTIPPMSFDELDIDDEIKSEVAELVDMKKVSSNVVTPKPIKPIHTWIEKEFDYIENVANSMESDCYNWDLLDDYFISII